MDDNVRTFFMVVSAPFGLVVGSFLNVVIFRLPRQCMSLARGRSRCPSCLTQIAWFDNLPLVSFVLLRGRCRSCQARISARYPFVEALTAMLFFAWAYRCLWTGRTPAGIDDAFRTASGLYVLASLVAASFIDMDFRILPDEITMSGTILSIAAVTAFPKLHSLNADFVRLFPGHWGGLVSSSLGAVVGGGVIYAVKVFGALVFRKEAMGGGDVWLVAFLGAYLGWLDVLVAFLLACLYGSVVGVIRLAWKKDHYMPFGPFLALGAVTMMFFSIQVYEAIRWYTSLFQPSGAR